MEKRLVHTRRWRRPVAALLSSIALAAVITGCGGGNSGPEPIGSRPNHPNVFGTPAATARPGSTATPTTRPGVVPTPTTRPGVVPTPTTRPGVVPTPTTRPGGPTPPPPTTGQVVTIFTSTGTFNTSTGQYTQDAADPADPSGSGDFQRLHVIAARPQPQPTADPNPGPDPTPDGSLTYLGTYTLSNGERGIFGLSVDAPRSPRTADAFGFPNLDFQRQSLDFATPVESGSSTVSVRVSGNSGSGQVRLSNGVSGSISINQRLSSIRTLPNGLRGAVRMKMTFKRR